MIFNNHMKKILFGILAVLCISSLATTSLASTSTYNWWWTQCTGVTNRGTLEIQANIGVPYAIISWNVPTSSFEYGLGCVKQSLHAVPISVSVSASGHVPKPTSSDPTSASGSITLQFLETICFGIRCNPPTIYYPKYGDTVTVSINACYGSFNQYCHGTTDTLKITS